MIGRRRRCVGCFGGDPEVRLGFFCRRRGFRFCFFGIGLCGGRLGCGILGIDFSGGRRGIGLCLHFLGVELSFGGFGLFLDSIFGGIGAVLSNLARLLGFFFDGVFLVLYLRLFVVTAREEEEREAT